MTRISKRDQIVEAADDLFYRQGFDHTSFADIAGAVRISRGNFYHHFKTKDDILDAVIAARLANTRAMLADWQVQGDSPAARIGAFIDILLTNRDKIERHGCPVGTLATELAKLNHGAQADAASIFTLFRTWLRRQFDQMGQGAHADDLALHLLARSQGIATLMTAYRDPAFLRRERDALHDWLDGLAPQPTRH